MNGRYSLSEVLFGPVFPRAFKRSSIGDRTLCEESYNALMEKDTALMASLSAKTQAMMATPMADLNAVHRGEENALAVPGKMGYADTG